MWLHYIFLKHFLLLNIWVVLSFLLILECHQMVLNIVCLQFEYTLAYSFIKLNMANNLIVSIWMSTKQWQIKRSLADLKCQNGSIMYGKYSHKEHVSGLCLSGTSHSPYTWLRIVGLPILLLCILLIVIYLVWRKKK